MATGISVIAPAGASLRWLSLFAVGGLAAMLHAATHINDRLGRMLAFLHPDKYPDDFYQQLQGLIAIGSGGLYGLGWVRDARSSCAFPSRIRTSFFR